MSEISKNDALLEVAAWAAAAMEDGHVPLFLICGKESTGGHRDYSIAGHQDQEYVRYVIDRLNLLMNKHTSN